MKCLESVNFGANNDLQEDLKIFKSDTFENYNSFVPVEVQSLCQKVSVFLQKKPTVLLGPISSTVTSRDFNYYVNDKRD